MQSLSLSESEARRAAACRAFWSDHPLNLLYRQRHGERTFSLREFKTFVLSLSADEFQACLLSAGVIR